MRRLLSYGCGYMPPRVRGTKHMDLIVDMVMWGQVPGYGPHEVLIMCQDLGYEELMREVLQRLWEEGKD